MSKNYWLDRLVAAQQKVSTANIKEAQEQLRKYYIRACSSIMEEFEATYNKLKATMAAGQEPTPADLYKLSKYWEMQGQLKTELQNLGDKAIELLSKRFEKQYTDIYNSMALPSKASFSTISQIGAQQTLNSVWAADSKVWSQRVWTNTEKLAQKLNDKLIECVVTGKKPSELKKALMETFGVSYNNANMLVETEMAHIQTQAAAQRYKDAGITKYKFIADTDERTCPLCGALDGKTFDLTEMKTGVNAVPLHPRCRCCIAPVVE